MLKVWRVLRLSTRSSAGVNLSRFMSSKAPTFSSTNSEVIARLLPSNIATMIITGLPNRPFPESYQVDLDTFKPAALSAVSMITRAMSEQQWDTLEGQLDEGCLESLRSIIQDQTYEENKLVQLNPEDVFFSFIANGEKCKSGKDLNLVTFSLPKLGKVKHGHTVTANLHL